MTAILLTGANRGIGLEFVRQYAREGARIFASCRHPAKADELNHITRERKNVTVHALDVTSDASVSALAKALKDEPIDILINNAGVGGRHHDSEAMDYVWWENVLRVNVMGPFRMAQAFQANLLKSKTRKLITITSMMGSTTERGGGSYAYRSSKAAVNNVMRGLSVDWRADSVIVVLLHPGWVKTDMGGPNATLDVGESVAGMRKVIAGLRPSDNGRFLDHSGKEIPW